VEGGGQAVTSIERFEDLVCWQKARSLTAAIYQATRQQEFAADIGLSNQIRRAAVSTMSNIAEGFERRGIGEFRHFHVIAKASCAEVRSQLYVANDVGHLTSEDFVRLQAEADEVARVIRGLLSYLDRQHNGISKRT
jgi:four helix bundle protein